MCLMMRQTVRRTRCQQIRKLASAGNWKGRQKVDAFGPKPAGVRLPGQALTRPLPLRLRPVLEELLSGAPDLTASRRLNVSPRTYTRRVAELLDYLGVTTRFQAGAEIIRRGWAPGPASALRERTSGRSATCRWSIPSVADAVQPAKRSGVSGPRCV
jgi:DNA-binding NarL/FixJ family response regulator